MTATRAFSRSYDALDDLFAFTAAAFASEDIAPGLRLDVDFVLEELFTNVVKYGRSTDAPVRIELAAVDGGVEVTLTDEDADDFDVTRARQADVHAPIEQRQPGGLGLHLIRKLVDHIEYRYIQEAGHAQVTFRKTLREPAHQGGADAGD